MAQLLGGDTITRVSFPITKYEEDDDGNLVVYGTVTDGSLDSDKQIVDPEWSAKALTEWMGSGPNLRVMHSPHLLPAGRGLQVDLGDGTHQLKALVVEPVAQKLVRNKVLRAYSVGIADPVIKRDPLAPGGRIVGGTLAEVSLVDRPANKNCQLTLAKSADSDTPWTTGDLQKALADSDQVMKVVGGGKVAAEYLAERSAWLDREPVPPAGSLATGTGFLAKMAARDAWQKWDEEGTQLGLDGTPEGFGAWCAKRDYAPNVGGGVDVDKLPISDFVDPAGRRFPIVTPGDVSDAVASYGRAKPLIPMDRFKRRLTAIARRKGDAFVKQLPESWEVEGAEKNFSTSEPLASGLAPYNLGSGGKRPRKAKKKPAADFSLFDVADADLEKGVKACRGCGAEHHADSKMRRCDKCGKKLPKASAVVKRRKRRLVPDSVAEVPRHREPDGEAVEELEEDAGMSTTPDPERDHTPASLKGKLGNRRPWEDDEDDEDEDDDFEDEDLEDDDEDDEDAEKGVDAYTLKRAHDAVCSAYRWDDVTATYPSVTTLEDVLVGKHFTGALRSDVAAITSRWSAALLHQERDELNKAFSDMYPSARPTPTVMSPGLFQRPYLAAGHAAAFPAGARGTSVPPPTRTPRADDFNRPLIVDGHQAAPPGDRGANLRTLTVSSGASREYYDQASRDAARNAMAALHDHLAAARPGMCPMAESQYVMPADMRASVRPVPVPGTQPAVSGGVVKMVGSGPSRKKIDKMISKAVRAATADVASMYEGQISALQADLDDLGAQPDPAQAPMRGVVRKAASTEPATRVSLAETAIQAEVADQIRFAAKFVNHPDPAKRDWAEQTIAQKMTQLPGVPADVLALIGGIKNG